MKVTFVNIDKKGIKKFSKNTKYVLITNYIDKINKYNDLTIKPIIILYNGSYVIDLENNNVIIDKSLDEKTFNNILNYVNFSKIKINILKMNDKIYELILNCDNIHRRLIIPYMFKDKYPNIKCNTLNKLIYIVDKKVSLLNSFEEVFNYLNLKNNYVDLENLFINVSNDGYYKDNVNWKGYEKYEY